MTRSTANDVRSLMSSGALHLPLPGSGGTDHRLVALADIARRFPVGVARVSEAHADAIAILAEAGREATPGAVYGVWASQHAKHGVIHDAEGGRIDGSIGFASGLGMVDRALVTAHTASGMVLIDVDVVSGCPSQTIRFDTGGWSTPALADTSTGSVTFAGHVVTPDHVVGEPGWYLHRIGFWHGACAPAACWAGAAVGLVEAAESYVGDDPHRRAHHGALLAHAWSLDAMLRSAGTQIDAAPTDAAEAERVARSLRFAVATICRDVMDRFGRAFGPRPVTQDADITQRILDLDLYIKQHHAERELPAISELQERVRR